MYEDMNLALKNIENFKNRWTLKRILDWVEKYDFSDGITVSKLAKELDLDPSTITRNCQKLEKENLIIKENKQAPYHITPKGYKIRFLLATMQDRRSKILKSNMPLAVLNKNGKRITQNKYWNFNLIKKCEFNDPRISFLSFANEIGASLIYLFLETIKPDNKIKVGRIERDRMMQDWLRDIIDPWVIFSKFCELSPVKQGRAIWSGHYFDKQDTDITDFKFRKLDPNSSFYELDVVTSKELFKIHKEVFPLVFSRISKHAEKLREEYKEALTRRKTII